MDYGIFFFFTDWTTGPTCQRDSVKEFIIYGNNFNHIHQRFHPLLVYIPLSTSTSMIQPYMLQMNVSALNNYSLPFTDITLENNNQHTHRSCPSMINQLYN